MTTPGDVQRLARWVAETEHEHLKTGDRRDPVTLPWMPYQPADFIAIMWDVMSEAGGSVFLDVGCGPGTKMAIAGQLLGLAAYGIEIDKVMAEQAGAHGAVYPGDALDVMMTIYAEADVIWLYRPFRDAAHEAKLEQLVIEAMKPGAILAGGSWETDVHALGWQVIVDDCLVSPDGSAKILRGAWMKPWMKPRLTP